MSTGFTLPIDDVLPELLQAISTHGQAVLQAPPGAGKTTKVPLALLDIIPAPGRILMLEPRRLAARAAAARMAETLGEKTGETVGYRIRGESKTSARTRIEVVTEGILTRMIQTDPELTGISCVIFDEFHERSLNADLGLALTCEIRAALREDLRLIVMSATLDAAPVAAMLGDAPVITSEGRAFPVETRWLSRPRPQKQRLEEATANLILEALAAEKGSLLAFLPGEGEIRRTEALLKSKLPPDCKICPLYGAMDFKAQRDAIRPAASGRKIVLATSIAETSLTIDGIRIVVDAGRSRRARFDPGSGMSRLVTERVTKAEATQRQGRAGRLTPGVCYRLWTKGEEGALAAFPPAEIESTDLTGLVLELALWGTSNPTELAFVTPPDSGMWDSARSLLNALGALDEKGAITAHGRALATLPLHPRLAHMLVICGPNAAPLAALLADRDPLPRAAPADLSLRIAAIKDTSRFMSEYGFSPDRGTLSRIKEEARRLARFCPKKPTKHNYSTAEMAALAYPDRIALRRAGEEPRFIMSGGKGALLHAEDPLANQRLMVATDLDGDKREARIRLGIAISESEIRALFSDQIFQMQTCLWSRRDDRTLARDQERLGAITLTDRTWKDVPPDTIATAALEGWQDLRPAFSKKSRLFLARARLMLGHADCPDLSDDALYENAADWLLPWLSTTEKTPRNSRELRAFETFEALRNYVPYPLLMELDRLVPAHFTSPLGNRIAIDYSGETPAIELRIQEVFGTTQHPCVGTPPQPLRMTLLSPARRPVQVTSDLPGFWKTSWVDVRKDMRGRYPRHPWPEDPTEAPPTLRVKPRNK